MGWTIEKLRAKLTQHSLTEDSVCRMLICLYDRQTDAERFHTNADACNARGFNKYDAKFLTSVAQQYKVSHYISPKQKAAVERCLVKYSKQLHDALMIGELKLEESAEEQYSLF